MKACPPAPRLIDGPEAAPVTVLLAHGAGAALDSPFMAAMARDQGRAAGRNSGRQASVRLEPQHLHRRVGQMEGPIVLQGGVDLLLAEALARGNGGLQVMQLGQEPAAS